MSNSVSSVVVNINGQNVTLDTADGRTFTKTLVAPDASSFNQSGGYYPVSVTATYATGTTTTVDHTHGTLGSACRLIVKETYRPTASITAPSNNAYLKNASQTIAFSILDNANGQSSGFSGIDTSSLSVVIASAKLNSSTTLHWADLSSYATAISGGYSISFSHTFDDSDDWMITVNVSDNDGNAAIAATAAFTIDTEAPALSVSSPADNLKTSNGTIAISGTTSDATSGPVTISVDVDGTDYGTLQVDQNGAFSGFITLTDEGDQDITITATDNAGNSTSITRSVYYSTSVPTITSVSIVPNPVDNGQTYVITVVAE